MLPRRRGDAAHQAVRGNLRATAITGPINGIHRVHGDIPGRGHNRRGGDVCGPHECYACCARSGHRCEGEHSACRADHVSEPRGGPDEGG